MMRIKIACLSLGCLLMLGACARTSGDVIEPSPLSRSDKDRLAQTIWKNECGGSLMGLTSWNVGEEFPSLGIGHFIWYPEGQRGIYEESFPLFVKYAAQRGVDSPRWVRGGCPYSSRSSFQADLEGPRLRELRVWLRQTVRLQMDFIMVRSAQSLPKMKKVSKDSVGLVQKYKALSGSMAGMYALIDYVNFKGEGTNPQERYQGEGWGLVQVLDAMPREVSVETAPKAFSKAAKEVLVRRVKNSPVARGEKRWLAGWQNRCDTYAKGLQ